MRFLKQFFTWWNGQTLNTRFFTWRKGEFVGKDDLGNSYFRSASAIPDSIPERRWVVYANYAEASEIPPGWHGWIHHRVDTLPANDAYVAREWEKPHQPNLTGSAKAYRPSGSIVGNGVRKQAPDYQAWKPE